MSQVAIEPMESFPEICLRDVATLISSMEARLLQRFDLLAVQLDECSKLRLDKHAVKKQTRISSVAQVIPAVTGQPSLENLSQADRDISNESLSKSSKTLGLGTQRGKSEEDTTKMGKTSSLNATKSLTATATAPNGSTVVGSTWTPKSMASSPWGTTSRPMWRLFGTRPSEAAKAFVKDALTKAQKRKIFRAQRDSSYRESSSEEIEPNPLPGIDAILDVRTQETTRTFESKATGNWWSADLHEFQWLSSAKRKAESVKSTVFSLLLAKGWVTVTSSLAHSSTSGRTQMRTWSQHMVGGPKFEALCSLMIILNAVILGYQVQYNSIPSNDGRQLDWPETVQTILTCWFAFEVILRIYAWRLNFFVSIDWPWNIFDLTVVAVSLIEFILQKSSVGSESSATNFAIVRMIRILRMVRAIRFIRVVRFFAELRMMIYSSMKSVKPFCWALGILLMIIYVFAIVTTSVVTDYRRDQPETDIAKMLDFFGSLYQSVYTLFMVISGGVSWIEPAEELIEVHWSFAIWMSLYVAFVVFAVLNIVTGIFIESALKSAQDDQDVVIQEEMNHEDSLARGFIEVFDRTDEDKSGYIDASEFDMALSDPRVRAFLHHLGLDVPEARGLFTLLDIGGTGKVYAPEFVTGCQQLKGPAKNVDVATLLFQNKRMMTLWAAFMSFVEDQFAVVLERMRSSEYLTVSQRSLSASQSTAPEESSTVSI